MTAAYIPVIHGAALDRPDEVDTIQTAEAIRAVLVRLGYRTEIKHIGPSLAGLAEIAAVGPELVFNLVEAIGGDASLAALIPAALDHHQVRYTGCRTAACQVCTEKTMTKRAIAGAGLPTPPWSLTGDNLDAAPRVIVKSLTEHGSLGIDARSVVPGAGAGQEIAAREARYGGVFFAEAFIEGREFNLSLLEGHAGPEVLPPAEIEFVDFPCDHPHIVDYEAKWIEDSFAFKNTPRRFAFPSRDRALLVELSALARRAWDLFDLAGYARVDFRVDRAGQPWILEVNANPCLAPDAGFFAAASQAGLSYEGLIARIVEAARNSLSRAA